MGICGSSQENVTSNEEQGVSVTVDENAGASFMKQYTLGKKLGSGTFSVVREGTHRATGKTYAIKCIKKSGLTTEDIQALQEEITILNSMDHENIMNLYADFEDETMYYLVTEMMQGGELFDRIVEKECYTEKEARDLVQLLIGAIAYIHDRNVVHRDLKPENLLLTDKTEGASIKIADFGFARQLDYADENSLNTACGTPGYVAPEILERQRYGKAVDMWSLGVITYILLCGYPPFHDEHQAQLFRKIRKGEFEFDSPYWDDVSDEAKDLISKMLTVNPTKRLTAHQALEHPWILGDNDVLGGRNLAGTLVELKKFNARRKFRAGVKTVAAINRMQRLLGAAKSAAEASEAEAAAEAAGAGAEAGADAAALPEAVVVEETKTE